MIWFYDSLRRQTTLESHPRICSLWILFIRLLSGVVLQDYSGELSTSPNIHYDFWYRLRFNDFACSKVRRCPLFFIDTLIYLFDNFVELNTINAWYSHYNVIRQMYDFSAYWWWEFYSLFVTNVTHDIYACTALSILRGLFPKYSNLVSNKCVHKDLKHWFLVEVVVLLESSLMVKNKNAFIQQSQ